MLTDDQKKTGLTISSMFCYEDDPGDIIEWGVTQDETWAHSSLWPRVKNAEQTLEAPLLTPPKKFKRDSQRVIMIDCLEQGRTINDA